MGRLRQRRARVHLMGAPLRHRRARTHTARQQSPGQAVLDLRKRPSRSNLTQHPRGWCQRLRRKRGGANRLLPMQTRGAALARHVCGRQKHQQEVHRWHQQLQLQQHGRHRLSTRRSWTSATTRRSVLLRQRVQDLQRQVRGIGGLKRQPRRIQDHCPQTGCRRRSLRWPARTHMRWRQRQHEHRHRQRQRHHRPRRQMHLLRPRRRKVGRLMIPHRIRLSTKMHGHRKTTGMLPLLPPTRRLPAWRPSSNGGIWPRMATRSRIGLSWVAFCML